MKKLDLLLSNIYLINFKMIFKLIRRYYYIAFITPVIVSAIAYYQYSNQKTVYISDVKFKTESEAFSAAENTILNMKGIQNAGLNLDEIKSLIFGWEFLNLVATDLSKDPHYKSYNYNQISQKTSYSNSYFFKNCLNNATKCHQSVLATLIPDFISIDKVSSNNLYKLKITSYDPKLSKSLLQIVVRTLLNERKVFINRSYQAQIDIMEKIIIEKNFDLKNKGLIGFHKRIDELKKTVHSLRNRRDVIKQKSFETQMEFKNIVSKYQYAKKTNKVAISSTKRKDYEKYQRLKDEAIRIRSDIRNLTEVGDSSDVDNQIVRALRVELSNIEMQISTFESKVQDIASNDDFYNKQQKDKNFLKLEMNIQKKKLEEMNTELDSLNADLSMYNKELLSLEGQESEYNSLKKYINEIEPKLISLRALSANQVSDIIFENINPLTHYHRPLKLSKVIIFSILLSLILIFSLVVSRFLFDDRIFTTNELQTVFSSIQILGEAPKFEQKT